MGLSLLFTSCNKNEPLEFDDKDAFVAFATGNYSVDEDYVANVKKGNGANFKIPVTLASIAGTSSTISYEIVDGTAKAGINYELAGGSSTLTFSSSNRVQNIEINIIDIPGEFTGDLEFVIRITNGGSVNIGDVNSCVVKISDMDHPLSFMLGDYTGSGNDSWSGALTSWSGVVLEKDDDGDVSKVWFRNMFDATSYNPVTGNYRVYGVVNEEKTEISIDVHQQCFTGNYNGYFEGAEIPFKMMDTGEKIIFDIDENGNLSIQGEYQVGVGAYALSGGAFAGWFERWGNCKFTKN